MLTDVTEELVAAMFMVLVVQEPSHANGLDAAYTFRTANIFRMQAMSSAINCSVCDVRRT
jgi:hypothetical protein